MKKIEIKCTRKSHYFPVKKGNHFLEKFPCVCGKYKTDGYVSANHDEGFWMDFRKQKISKKIDSFKISNNPDDLYNYT